MKRNVIFDCDPGHDDVMALLLALHSELLDIKLITTCAGNQTQEKTLLNTLKILSYIDRTDIEVARGADSPILGDLMTADFIHGESGLEGADIGEPLFRESERSAIEAMRDVILNSKEKMTIIATGPLTNVAILFKAYPKLKDKIDCISIMGGACFGGNITSAAEFNIFVDPEAAEIVFKSGVPIIMSGLDVTRKALLYKEDIEKIRSIGNMVSDILVPLLEFYSSTTSKLYSIYGKKLGAPMHDPCAVAYLLEPSIFKGVNCNVDIETSSSLTRGCTLVDYANLTNKPKNSLVLFDVDRERLVNKLITAIASYK